MTILIGRSFKKTYRRQIARRSGSEEVLDIVLMIRRACISDFRNRGGPSVLWIRGRSVIVEERVGAGCSRRGFRPRQSNCGCIPSCRWDL